MIKKLAITACLISTATASHAFMANNGLRVKPQSQTSFEVPYRGLSGAADFWCAAGDYVISRLRMPASTRIYRTSSPPRRAGQGISFSLSPEGSTRTGLATFGDQRSVSASHAKQLCEQQRLLNDFFP